MDIQAAKKLGNQVIQLFYPETCEGCGIPLISGEKVICIGCQIRLPGTHFNSAQDNAVHKIFRGRIELTYAMSFMYYRKSGLCQRLIAGLKYKNKPYTGELLGYLFALELKELGCFKPGLFTLCPIPLHKRRFRQRGYNQSEEICKGLSRGLGLPYEASLLYRVTATSTQTRKNRFERWKNTEEIFEVKEVKHIPGNHIILVDDIVTTGATLESAAIELKKQYNCKISILTLGFADSNQ